MTRLTKYILILTMLLSVSCEDWLDLTPPDGLVQDEYWKTKEDVMATLMGAYQIFTEMDELLFLYGEVRGDLVSRDNNTPGYIEDVMDGNIYPSNDLCNWSLFYEIINYCNFVLKYNPIIFDKDPTYTEYQMLGVRAEAIYLRSLAYFYLVRIFKEVPFFVEPTQSDNVDLYLPKSSDTLVLSTIKSELLEVRNFVTDDYGSIENNIGRASRNAINALLADISLWNFEYEESLGYIAEIEKTIINLVQSGQWFSIYYPGNSYEGIFELQYNSSLGQSNNLYKVTYTERNYTASITAIELLSRESAKEFIRGDGSFRVSDSKIWKYCGSAADGASLRPGSERASANWIVYRFADILLMKAEALSQLERYNEAIVPLNEVRKRANMDELSMVENTQEFEDMILNERAKELAFEGKRWFDLLRMGRRNDYQRKDKLIGIIIKNVPANQRLVLASKLTNPNGWYLPIEDTELERNKNLVQNPYYEGY
jgi:hypothetical protein